jgi:hypothetical protein
MVRTPSGACRAGRKLSGPAPPGSLYNMKLTGDDVPDNLDSETDFGINAGAGFDFQAGAVGLFIEGRFHNVFTEDESTNFIPITVGVRLGGGGS